MRDHVHSLSRPIIVLLVLYAFLLMNFPCAQCSDTKFLDSFEGLLRNQSNLLTSFEYLLHRTPTNVEEKIEFLNSFEDLLRRQANLIAQFEDLLKAHWDEKSVDEQEKFLESFGDLIKREFVLVSSFETLCDEDWSQFPPETEVKFLASFEDLLRRMTNLYKSYEELFKSKHGGIFIEQSANKEAVQKGEVVTYIYTVKNVYKTKKLSDVIIVDDKLGTIADGVSLNPGESKSFARSTELEQTTCNQAEAMGRDPEGNIINDESGVVCVLVKNGGLPEPVQYGQYCESSKVAGNGVIDVATSIMDKDIALDYHKNMAGDGDIEMDSENSLSEKASKLKRVVDNKTVPLNFYETTNIEYSGKTPLNGYKMLSSKGFYGGIGADINEIFSATQIEDKQKSFFASTDPNTHVENFTQSKILAKESPAHLVGIDSENSFNGTWGLESRWHQILKKDVQDRQLFTGAFETEKSIKFHENPAPSKMNDQCEGLDC
jgi:hypothetical protein